MASPADYQSRAQKLSDAMNNALAIQDATTVGQVATVNGEVWQEMHNDPAYIMLPSSYSTADAIFKDTTVRGGRFQGITYPDPYSAAGVYGDVSKAALNLLGLGDKPPATDPPKKSSNLPLLIGAAVFAAALFIR